MSKISAMPNAPVLLSTHILQLVDTAEANPALKNQQMTVPVLVEALSASAYMFGASNSGDLAVSTTSAIVGDWATAALQGQTSITVNKDTGLFTLGADGVYKLEASVVLGENGGTTNEEVFMGLAVDGSSVAGSGMAAVFYSTNKQNVFSLNGAVFYSGTAGQTLGVAAGM
ncbi:hypothetical protein DRQ25_15330, partial [Candidatus Fermentibacteria bacterium]